MQSWIKSVKDRAATIGGATIGTLALFAGYKAYKHYETSKTQLPSLLEPIDEQNLTKLETACKSIISRGGSVDNELTSDNLTPFMVTCREGMFEYARILLENGANPSLVNENCWRAIHFAASEIKSKDIVKMIIEKDPTNATVVNNFNGWTPFLLALSKDNNEVADMIFNMNVIDINQKTLSGHTALMIAACNGNFTFGKTLIERGAKIEEKENKQRETALHYACSNSHIDLVKLLLDNGANINVTSIVGATPIHYACKQGNPDLINLLIERGANVNAEKSDGSTPLHIAATLNHMEAASILLKHGARLDSRSKFGRSSLQDACFNGSYEMAELLLQHGADVSDADNDGLTALHTACSVRAGQDVQKQLKIIQLLIDNGADVNMMIDNNCTPLQKAVCCGESGIPMVELLLKHGADPTIENILGWSSLHWASSENGCESSRKLIENYLKENNPSYLETFNPNKPKDFSKKKSKLPASTLTDEEKKNLLYGKVNLEGISDYIRSGKCKNVIVLTGAGISVNAGIPDFRSPNGIYSTKTCEKYNLPSVSAAFDLSYLRYNPQPFYSICREIFLPVVEGKFTPTLTHYFIRLLHDKGILLRNYTQNIDMLELKAGIPEDKIVESHGTFGRAFCMNCGKPCEIHSFWKEIQQNQIPKCKLCGGVARPDVTFFGEGLPARFGDLKLDDMKNCDLLIIMGTSLVVYPFAGLVNEVRDSTPRLLINKDPVGAFKRYIDEPELQDQNYRDCSYIGNCDEGIKELARLLGWGDELHSLKAVHDDLLSKSNPLTDQ